MPQHQFKDYVLELLSCCHPAHGNIFAKRMFGGFGIFYPDDIKGLMFALISDDQLYLKADDHNRQKFVGAELPAFTHYKKGKPFNLSYYLAPEALFEDEVVLQQWVQLSIEVALRQSQSP